MTSGIDSARVDGEIEDVPDPEIARYRLGEQELKRKDGADEDQHQNAVRDVEEGVRRPLRARRDQPLKHEAKHRHRQQDLKGEAAIEMIEKLSETRKPVIRVGALGIGAAPANADSERDHQQKGENRGHRAKRQARAARPLGRGFETESALFDFGQHSAPLPGCRIPKSERQRLLSQGENQGFSSNPGKCELQAITWVIAARSYSSPER